MSSTPSAASSAPSPSPSSCDESAAESAAVEKMASHETSCESEFAHGKDSGVDGRNAWLIVFGSFWVHAFGLGLVYTFGVLLIPLSEYYDVGRGAMSLVGAGLPALMLLFGIPSGMLSDRFGYRVMVMVGGSLMAIGFLLSSAVPKEQWWLIYITYSGLVGTGLSLSFIPAIGAVGQWFHERRGLATGVAVSGSGFGNLILPPLVILFLDVTNVTITLQLLAFCGVFIALSATVIKHRVVPPRTSNWGIFKDRKFQYLFGVGVFGGYGYLVPFVHLAPYAEDKGIDPILSALLLSMMGVSSLVGRILLGFVADKLGRIAVLQTTFATMAVFCFIWVFLEQYWMLAIFAIVFGFFGGGFISLLPVTIADIWGVERIASIVGLLYFSAAFGNLAGPTVTGILFDVTGDYVLGILIAAFTLLVASIFMCLLPSKISVFHRLGCHTGAENSCDASEVQDAEGGDEEKAVSGDVKDVGTGDDDSLRSEDAELSQSSTSASSDGAVSSSEDDGEHHSSGRDSSSKASSTATSSPGAESEVSDDD